MSALTALAHTVIHRIAAGSDFDATVPATTPTQSSRVKGYPEDDGGGLFVLPLQSGARLTEPIEVIADFGDAATWEIAIGLADSDADDVVILSGTSDDGGDVLLQDGPRLGPGQAVKVRTTDATEAMRCMVRARHDAGTEG